MRVKTYNVIGNWLMRILSLFFLFMLSYQYNGHWTYALGGACLIYLGIEMGKVTTNKNIDIGSNAGSNASSNKDR